MNKLNLNHLYESIRPIVDMPIHERIRCVQQERFVVHRRLKAIVDDVEFLLRSPPRTRAAGLLVAAAQGSGKTMLAKAIDRRHGAQAATETESRRTHRAVMITMTNARDSRVVYTRILDALGAPIAASARYSDREREVLRVLKSFDTRLLVVDEIQDILKTTTKQRTIALDVVKFLMNEAMLPVLALGTDVAKKAISTDPHLAKRFAHRALPVWTFDDDLREFLEALEKMIPLKYPSNLSSPTIMKKLVELSEGVLHNLVQLIDFASLSALVDGSERITLPLIQRASKEMPIEAIDVLERSAA